MVVPRLERPDGTLEHSTYPFPSLTVAATMAAAGPAWLPPSLTDRLQLEGCWRHDRPRSVDWAVGAAWLLRREALDDVGPLDERFFMYAEDVEWCWRARRRGWDIWFEPAATVVHVGNASGEHRHESDAARTVAYLRNTYRFYEGAHGRVRGVAYRGLNLLAAGRIYASARLRGDGPRAEYWRKVARAHLAPAGGYDR
jgi:GT2 family glycosyltransferase